MFCVIVLPDTCKLCDNKKPVFIYSNNWIIILYFNWLEKKKYENQFDEIKFSLKLYRYDMYDKYYGIGL